MLCRFVDLVENLFAPLPVRFGLSLTPSDALRVGSPCIVIYCRSPSHRVFPCLLLSRTHFALLHHFRMSTPKTTKHRPPRDARTTRLSRDCFVSHAQPPPPLTMPRSGMNATFPKYGSSTIAWACGSLCLFACKGESPRFGSTMTLSEHGKHAQHRYRVAAVTDGARKRKTRRIQRRVAGTKVSASRNVCR